MRWMAGLTTSYKSDITLRGKLDSLAWLHFLPRFADLGFAIVASMVLLTKFRNRMLKLC